MHKEKLLSQKETARYFFVSSNAVRQWRKQGCPFIFVGVKSQGKGCRPRFNPEKVKMWLESRTTGKEVQA